MTKYNIANKITANSQQWKKETDCILLNYVKVWPKNHKTEVNIILQSNFT